MLRPLVSAWFQELFHSSIRSSFHLSLTVLFAIGLSGVFSLTRWSWQIHTEFLVFRATQDTTRAEVASCTGLSPSMITLSSVFQSLLQVPQRGPTTPLMPEH